MSIQLEKLREVARAEVRRLVAEHNNRPWLGTGRYEPLPCRGCGGQCDPSRRWCEVCSAVLP